MTFIRNSAPMFWWHFGSFFLCLAVGLPIATYSYAQRGRDEFQLKSTRTATI